MKINKTNAVRLLDHAKIAYELIPYRFDENDLSATHVAEALNEPLEQVFKTLVLKGDRNGYFVCVVPGDSEVDLKKAAKVSGNKNCDLIPQKDLLSLTGYIRGGCSPVGMKKHFPVYIHENCLLHASVFVSAGQRGLQMKIRTADLIRITKSETVDLIKEVVAFGLTLEELWQLFPIELVQHNPEWHRWYEDESQALLALLGSAVGRIDHIGSTAVNGMLAKPIVDILLQITDGCDCDGLKTKLAKSGWLLMAEQGGPCFQLDWNKGYTPSGFAEKVYHLHIRRVGDWDELYFRDYIASHPDAVAEYAMLKRRLLSTYRYDRDAYTEAKSEFIRACTAQARSEKPVGE